MLRSVSQYILVMRRVSLFTILLAGLSFLMIDGAYAKETKKSTVCLNMIVKDESKVICRCLESLLPIIDYWVIVDTGSTDGTQKIIKDFMKSKKVKGELHERPWVNFGHNRNEALQLALGKSDYILFIDADEFLTYEENFKLPHLDKDFYYIPIELDGLHYKRVQLIKSSPEWKWVGALHEVLVPPPGTVGETLEGVVITSTRDGARSQDPQKYLKDAQILEKALQEEPNNTRYMFYLAQSYRDAGDNEKALQYYQRRIDMGGWEEEVFWSKLQLGIIHQRMGAPDDTVISCYKDAYFYRPTRAEPLYYLANFMRSKSNFKGCYEVAKIGQNIPVPEDVLFLQKWMYDYGLKLECSVGAYWIGNYIDCKKLSLEMLQDPTLPEDIHQLVQRNLGFANMKLLDEYFSQESHSDQELKAG